MIYLANENYKQLIPDRIFIGGVDAIDELMENEKIDIIFDVRAHVDGPLATPISKHTPLLDTTPEEQDATIQQTVKEVVQAYEEGKNIYFHCNSGNGRGGTVATATLLELGLAKTVEEAEAKAQEIRPSINVRPKFKEALHRIYDEQ